MQILGEKLQNIKVDVDTSKLQAMHQESRERLRADFDGYISYTQQNNKQLQKMHKEVSSKRLLYLILLNLLLILITGISGYIAIANHIQKSDYEQMQETNQSLTYQNEHFRSYLQENEKAMADYKKWADN